MKYVVSSIRASAATAPRRDFRVTAEGAVDLADDEAYLDMRIPEFGSFQMRQIGPIFYSKFPKGIRSEMPQEKPWLKMDLDTLFMQSYGTTYTEFQGTMPDDLTEEFRYLKDISSSVKRVETVEVRGIETTRYRARLSFDKAATGQDEEIKAIYSDIEEELGMSSLPVDAWIDEQGRVRRYKMSLPIPNDDADDLPKNYRRSMASQITVIEDLYDFGTPVEVDAPPAGQTTDLTGLYSQSV